MSILFRCCDDFYSLIFDFLSSEDLKALETVAKFSKIIMQGEKWCLEPRGYNLWKRATTGAFHTWPCARSSVTALLLTGAKVFAATFKRPLLGAPVYCFSLETHQSLAPLKGHHHGVTSIAANSSQIVTASQDRTVRIWGLATGQEQVTLQMAKIPMTVSASESSLAIKSLDGSAEVWSLATRSRRTSLSGEKITSLAFYGEDLVLGREDGALQLWDVQNEAAAFEGHEDSVVSEVHFGSGCLIYSGTVIGGSPHAVPLLQVEGLYSSRIGFPNPSYRNCPYNSFGIVMAHTQLFERAQEEYHARQIETKMTALKAQINAELWLVDDQSPNVDNQSPITEATRECIKNLKQAKDRSDIEGNGRVVHIRHLDAQKEFLDKKRKKLQELVREFDELYKLMMKMKNATRVVAILRGQQQGTLCEQDAQDLSSLSDLLQDPQPSPNTTLHMVVYQKPWKVIRIGGHGHLWTYVRNKDHTVDEINDQNIYYKVLTFEQILTKWSSREEWRKTQISFYGDTGEFHFNV